jgi:2-hydroxychromene-2-carboxylate isomerase
MKTHALTFYFDPISPYAHLAFARLPAALEGLSYSVSYRPLVFAGLLKHHGQLGPAEIAPKRAWTFRRVAWFAAQQGVMLELPAAHPFNPVALMRVGLAAGRARGLGNGLVNREIAQALLLHVWNAKGLAADDAARLAALAARLGLADANADDAIKAALIANGEAAIAHGVFGVPTVRVEESGECFWGQDGLAMLRAYLAGEPWFAANWESAAAMPQGVARRRD